MTFRQNLACHVTPLLLRVVLAATFLWAGLGKIMEQDAAVTAENAQQYVDMGSISPSEARDAGFEVSEPASDDGDDAETDEPPAPGPEPVPDQTETPPEPTPQDEPGATPEEGAAPGGQAPEGDGAGGDGAGAQEPVGGGTDEGAQSDGDDDFFKRQEQENAGGGPTAGLERRIVLVQDDEAAPEAGSGELSLRRVQGLALGIKGAATPDDSGRSLLPTAFGKGSTPVMIAWAIALTEVVGGIFVLLGFLTRLAGLALAGVMGGALWMAGGIGTAVVFGPAVLGFLPDHPAFSMAFDHWKEPLWQLSILMAALGVVFSGAGFLSLDRLVFGPLVRKPRDED